MYTCFTGITRSVLIPLNYLVIPDYFVKHRSLALSTLQSSVGVCQITMPLLITYLQNAYGDKGAVLIHSGLILNCVVGAALFRPISNYSKLTKSTLELREDGCMIQKKEDTYSAANLNTHRSCDKFREDMESHFKGCWNAVKSFKLLTVIAGPSIFAVGYANFLTLVPFVMHEEGHTKQDIAWCLSAYGLASAGVRFVVTPFVGKSWFRPKYAYLAGAVCASVSTFGNVELKLYRRILTKRYQRCNCFFIRYI